MCKIFLQPYSLDPVASGVLALIKALVSSVKKHTYISLTFVRDSANADSYGNINAPVIRLDNHLLYIAADGLGPLFRVRLVM